MIGFMPTASHEPRVEEIHFDAFAASLSARVDLPSRPPRSMVMMLSGVAMFGLDAERPATRGLQNFGEDLARAMVASGRGVVRPDPFEADRQADGCVDAVTSLGRTILEHWPDLPVVHLGLSAAAPLIAVAGDPGTPAAAFILISPPILETYGNRPDRLDLAFSESLGIPPEIAADLGARGPMHAGASVAPRALVVHGAADVLVPPSDAIGWRASLAAAGVDAARLEIGFAGHDLEPCQEAALDAIVEHLDEIDA